MSTPTTLYDVAVQLKDAIVARFVADGVALPDAERRFVTGVEPVAACDTLAVSWALVGRGLPGVRKTAEPVRHNFVRLGLLRVYLFRCLSAQPQYEGAIVALPTATALEADALVLMTDALTLHRAITGAYFAGTFGGYTRAVELTDAIPLPVSAGIAGTMLEVAIDLF